MENIRNILNSEPKLLVGGNKADIKVELTDNRFELLKQNVNLLKNKDDEFYAGLIKLISGSFDELYDGEIKDFSKIIIDKDNILTSLDDYNNISSRYDFKISRVNKDFATNMFNYICDILEKNKNIKLDKETLTKLLNRNPELFTLTTEPDDYLYRLFDFERISKILNKNQTLKKSNISIDEVYQLLIDTCQIDNQGVFGNLVSPEEFKENNKKIVAFLKECTSKGFVDITNIITRKLDENFDRLSIIKERKNGDFWERVIIQFLRCYLDAEEANFIHELLNDEERSIDYSLHFSDFAGQTSLRELMALSENETIIKDLLSKEENIHDYYGHGERMISLYMLYAIIGEYEQALNVFQKKYHYASGFTDDFVNGFNEDGYARGDFFYEDSLASFIEKICTSFNNKDIEYSTRVNIISRILNSENVKYINLEETLPLLKDALNDDDFSLLLDSFIEKYKSGKLGFIVVSELEEMYSRYDIRIASDEQVQEILSKFTKKQMSKVLKQKSNKDKNNN